MTPHRPARPTALALAAALAVLAGLTASVPAGAQARPAAGPPSATAAELPSVTATAETATLFDDEEGGNANADDPAIWRNDADPARSLVIATAKEGGLRVYDLKARQVQALTAPAGPTAADAPGRFNNVDLVHRMRLSGGARADLAVTTDRGNDRLRVYRIDPGRPGGPLKDVTAPTAPPSSPPRRTRSTTSAPPTASPPGPTAPPAARTPWSAAATRRPSRSSNSPPPPAAR